MTQQIEKIRVRTQETQYAVIVFNHSTSSRKIVRHFPVNRRNAIRIIKDKVRKDTTASLILWSAYVHFYSKSKNSKITRVLPQDEIPLTPKEKQFINQTHPNVFTRESGFDIFNYLGK